MLLTASATLSTSLLIAALVFTPLAVLEQFGLLDALYPGRFDLGLGRSAQRRASTVAGPPPEPEDPGEERVVDGLLIPKAFSFVPILRSSRSKLFASLLTQPGATTG